MRIPLLPLLLLAAPLAGCLSTPWLPPAAPSRRAAAAAPAFREPLSAGQLVFHADFALPAGHRMVAELTGERQLICDRLAVPAGKEPIHVYLFADEETYRGYVNGQFPNFPQRRAIFVETDVRLAVYAHWSDRVAEDLRHEVAHGYLHSAVPNLPLWLDEGLAEYFEVGRGRRGVNRAHVDYLLAQLAVGSWRPDLPRLERLAVAGDMTQLDYAESWLWVHYLLESPEAPPALLSEHLNALRKDSPPATLGEKLSSGVITRDASLLAHLTSLSPDTLQPDILSAAKNLDGQQDSSLRSE
jgi:hypothetical protein